MIPVDVDAYLSGLRETLQNGRTQDLDTGKLLSELSVCVEILDDLSMETRILRGAYHASCAHRDWINSEWLAARKKVSELEEEVARLGNP